jgi:hypothetical protein
MPQQRASSRPPKEADESEILEVDAEELDEDQ